MHLPDIQNKNTDRRWQTFFWIFLILYGIYGIATMPNYGVPLDEYTQRDIGRINNLYIIGKADIDDLAQHKYFGPVIESTSYLAGQLIYNSDSATKLYLRHGLMFALFWVSLIYFKQLAWRLTKHIPAAVITTITLACSPRLFAHAHYNTKDTAFLVLVIIALALLLKYLQLRHVRHLIFAAIWLGVASTIRLAGVFVIMAVLARLFSEEENRGRAIFGLIIFSTIGYFITFPYMLANPTQGIKELLTYTSQNPYPWPVFFAGKIWPIAHGIWYYVPLSLAITVAVPIIILFIIFFAVQFVKIIKKRISADELLVFNLFLLPMLYFVLKAPVFYNLGRHSQFLFIPIFLGAAYIISFFWQQVYLRYTTSVILGLSALALPANYANEMVYFNGIKSQFYAPYSFEMDYWTVGAKQAIEDLVANKDSVKIYCFTTDTRDCLKILDIKTRQKVHFTSKDSANYELEFFREKPLIKTAKTIKAYGAKNEPYLLVNKLK